MIDFFAKIIFSLIAPVVMIGFVTLCFVFLQWDFGVVQTLDWLVIRKIYLALFLFLACMSTYDEVKDW